MSQTVREPQRGHARATPPERLRARRVVIAEDEALPAELLRRTLARMGHVVVGSAQNGAEAIALTRQLKPDVVVLDLRMPVMDGWTAMAVLAREAIAPFVVVSALDDRETMVRAAEGGAGAFLTKPVREDDLERALEFAIARFGEAQTLRTQRNEEAARADALAERLGKPEARQPQLAGAAQRAAVASLAQSLTHEINNALTPIMGNAQIIGLLHAHDAETVSRTGQIIEYARRIANWTGLFRQTTEGNHEWIDFSFNGLLEELFGLYGERLTRFGIAAELDLDANVGAVRGQPQLIQQALALLLQNAIEAMEGGGRIVVRTRYAPDGGALVATLSDSGKGIAAEDLARVFEPGFATDDAPPGARTGWGLFPVQQIVEAQGGSMEVASPAGEAGRGTTVTLRLPLAGVR